jgi:hypothetical protein
VVSSFFESGRWDLNPGPLAPHASALAGLRHAPIYTLIISHSFYSGNLKEKEKYLAKRGLFISSDSFTMFDFMPLGCTGLLVTVFVIIEE